MYFNTYRKSLKVRNLERDPRVSCLVTTSDESSDFAAVEIGGTAAIVAVDQLPESLLSRHTSVISDDPTNEQVRYARERMASGRRVYVQVSPHSARWCASASAPLLRPGEGVAPAPWPESSSGTARGRELAMSAAEVNAYLAEKSIAAFATLSPEGAPSSVPARYVAKGGSMLLAVPTDDPAIQHVRARERACATIEEFPTYSSIKGVILQGRAGPTTANMWGIDVADSFSSRFTAVTMQIDRTISFDFGKIRSGH